MPISRLLLKSILLLALAASPIAARTSPQTQPVQAATDFDSISHSAAAARDAGRSADAIDLYRRGVALRPDWAEGWWYLGTMLYDTDQFREAIPALQKVMELAPQAPDVANFLGLCEFETGDYDSARKHLEAGWALSNTAQSQQDPQLERVVSYHLALLVNRAGDSPRALEILNHDFSQATPPKPVVFTYGLATLHIPLLPNEVDASKEAFVQSVGELASLVTQGRAAQTLDRYAQLVNQNANTPYLHAAYAAALEAAGKHEEAQAQTKRETSAANATPTTQIALAYANEIARARLTGKDAPAAAPTKPEDATSADALRQHALQLFSSAHYADAIPALKAWLAADDRNGTAWAMLGLAEFEQKDYDSALVHLEKGSALGIGGSPDAVRFARYRLALLLIRQGQFDRATNLLVPEAEGNGLAPQIQSALGLALLHKKGLPEDASPSDEQFIQSAGHISLLLHQSKYADAFPELEQLIQLHPHEQQLHYAYGVGLAALSRYDEALAQFDAETRISPHSEQPWVQRAFVLLQTRKAADALVAARRAVELAPESGEAHYVLGRSYFDSAQWQDALKELQIAARLNPGSAEIHFNLAKTYAKLNQPEDAARERATFARLNAEIEKQRSQQGSQSYGAAHTPTDLSQAQPPQPAPQK